MPAYSFLNCQATIVGPGGAFSLGSGSATAEEGIEITMTVEKGTLTIGADGTPMHNLIADKSAAVIVRLLKTSPYNAKLMAMYDFQSQSSSLWGQNVINVSDPSVGDSTTCRSVAFRKKPDIRYAKEGGIMEWEMIAGYADSILGIA